MSVAELSDVRASRRLSAVADALYEAIEELGSVPSGHLYARVMGVISYSDYERAIKTLVCERKISESMFLLTIIGS